jgi:hypothetical protein
MFREADEKHEVIIPLQLTLVHVIKIEDERMKYHQREKVKLI